MYNYTACYILFIEFDLVYSYFVVCYLISAAELLVTVNDTNDNPPVFTRSVYNGGKDYIILVLTLFDVL